MSREATSDIKTRVARHFSAPEWFTTFEFPLWDSVQVEGARDRQLDALAISRVASRGNEIVGIEIKTDRADWLRELANPLKAEGWIRLLDRFCVIASKGVIKAGEVPAGWGLLEENGSGLRQILPGLVLSRWKEDGAPDPVPRSLWIRVLRRTLESEGIRPLIAAAYEQGKKEKVAEASEQVRRDLRDAESRLVELRRMVADFEKASGLKLEPWDGGRIGEAVKVVREKADFVHTTGYSFKNIRNAVRDLDNALEAAGWQPDPED